MATAATGTWISARTFRARPGPGGCSPRSQSKNYFYRLDYEEVFWGSQPYGQVFLEHKDVFGLKVRFAIGNLFNSQDRSQSVNYVDRRDGPVDYTRDFTLTFHPIYRLQISGTF